jgi:hypothetical protein
MYNHQFWHHKLFDDKRMGRKAEKKGVKVEKRYMKRAKYNI